MPELPEVHTTSTELNKLITGKQISDIWNDYKSDYYIGKKQIKDPAYFKEFKKRVLNSKIKKVYRRAKNVLIDLENSETILIHMKMTGHLLYGEYEFNKKKKEWLPVEEGPLKDPFNKWIRFVITFSDGNHLAFSDMRKFAKVTLENDLKNLGPEPLDSEFTFDLFKERIFKKSNGNIKTVLMNQELIAGIGNIYSDEALWMSKIHPEDKPYRIENKKLRNLFRNIQTILNKGIQLSGDSMSDYRRPDGTPGEFHKHHNVYQRKNEKCNRKKCSGIIQRIVVNGRSSHFCPKCQINKNNN